MARTGEDADSTGRSRYALGPYRPAKGVFMRMERLRGAASWLIALLCFAAPVSGQDAAAGAASKVCDGSALARTRCLIQMGLEDLEATYPHVGGGGITEIRAMATNVYRISISQEERIDRVTYEFDVKPDGKTVILKRTEDSEPAGHE